MPICESYVSAMRAMGHQTLFDNSELKGALAGASTDMGLSEMPKALERLAANHVSGNVSYAVPGFHGIFTIPAEGVNHTPQFTDGAGSPEAYERSLASAAGMAVVACQILVDDKFAEAVRKDFERV